MLARATPQEAMRLHIAGLDEVLHGLGSRSARHVMNRADLLIMQVIMLLAERYREHFVQHVSPQQQMLLPGFAARVA